MKMAPDYFTDEQLAEYGLTRPEDDQLRKVNFRGLCYDDSDLVWGDKKLLYYFDSSVPSADKAMIKEAMADWSRVCGIRFVYKDTFFGLEYKISYDKSIDAAGRSTVGEVWYGGWLDYSVSSYEVILHELGHGMGLLHEHQRPDRDFFVKVKSGDKTNYGKS